MKTFLNCLRRALRFLIVGCTSILCAAAFGQQPQAPGFYRGKLGAFEITAISDGDAPRHLDQILSKPEIALIGPGFLYQN